MKPKEGMDLKYKDKSGKSISISITHTKPLLLTDLEKTKGEKKQPFYLEVSGTEIEDVTTNKAEGKLLTLSMKMSFHHKPKIFCLVDGGWLPPAFSLSDTYLVDRNVVSALKENINKSSRFDYKSTHWWLQFKPEININPLLYAMEGDKQRTPDYEEFCSQFIEASEHIKIKLPQSKQTNYKEIHYKTAYKQLLKLKDKNTLEIKFLKEASKSLVNRVSDRNLKAKTTEIIDIADSINLERNSLVLVLALACIYERKDGSGLLIGRKIINPSKSYSINDAYNCISDLRAIEILIASKCFDLDLNVSFLTSDVALAGFWCALGLKNYSTKNGNPKFSIELNNDLFPRIETEESEQLKKLLQLY